MPKYQSYPTVNLPNRQWPNKVLTTPPLWCSVDLRDGNQALATPMNIAQKLTFFKVLTKMGIKHIEVGFPSASQVEFDFTRQLIEDDLIPSDVTIQVLTQARQHLIERTVESLQGAKSAIIHIYNSTSEQQRRVTFGKTKAEIKEIAIQGIKDIIDLLPKLEGTLVTLEYSPESFTGTELDYALEVCEAVIDTWNPSLRGKIIINLPSTVELSLPNVYADRIEWFCQNLKHRDKVILSLHTHNDRGTGTASTELGLLAGADRVEGTLFGNGERTGNLDLINVAGNLFTQGVDPGIDLSDIPHLRKVYEECTGMTVDPRHPYGGDLVFTAFSGSHQDAISKGFSKQSPDPQALWDVPYLPIDPKDIGRGYEAIIRVNSQSGKGGVAFILENEYGIRIPKTMQPDLGKHANDLSEELSKELTPREIYSVFEKQYLKNHDRLKMISYDMQSSAHQVHLSAKMEMNGQIFELKGLGNGPIDAYVHALQSSFSWNFNVEDYSEQALGVGSESEALSFIALKWEGKKIVWGAGKDTDTTEASFNALLSSLNRCGLTV